MKSSNIAWTSTIREGFIRDVAMARGVEMLRERSKALEVSGYLLRHCSRNSQGVSPWLMNVLRQHVQCRGSSTRE